MAFIARLGLYYKWQTFFFIPLNTMQTCIVLVISFNYAARNIDRCKETLATAIRFGLVSVTAGTICFVAEAKQNIQRSDKARGAYYRHISSKRKGDGRYYNLMIDSSIGVEETAEMIFKYVSK